MPIQEDIVEEVCILGERVTMRIPEIVGFVDASNHPYTCTCKSCEFWWLRMGPDENGRFGPFGLELWDAYSTRRNKTVAEAQLAFASYTFYTGSGNPFPKQFSDAELTAYILTELAGQEE